MKTFNCLIFTKKPTPECHASTVLPLPDGTVLAAWFGGTRESTGDVDIWVSRFENGEWSKPYRISAYRTIPHWNPVLFLRKDGTVQLFFKVGRHIPSWRTFTCFSTDGGRSFSKPQELVPGDRCGGRGPVKNKAIRLESGRVLAPASTEKKGWQCFVDISDDDGASWRKTEKIETDKVAAILNSDNGYTTNAVPMIQPTLWESAPGKVHMLTRTAKGRIYRSDSSDAGETWCRAYPTVLPNNNSGIDLDMTPDGRLFLLSNPVSENWGDRTPLTLQMSEDNGETWQTILTLEDVEGEFSYPAIKYYEGKLYITYTHDRKEISYWEITL